MEKTAAQALFSAPADGDTETVSLRARGAPAGVTVGLGASSAFSPFPSSCAVPPADPAPTPRRPPSRASSQGGHGERPGASSASPRISHLCSAPRCTTRRRTTTRTFQPCLFTAGEVAGRAVAKQAGDGPRLIWGPETEREKGVESEVIESCFLLPRRGPRPREAQ